MNKRFPLIIGILALSALGAMAQRDNRIHEKGVVSVANSDTANVSKVEEALKSVSPASPSDNGLPRFAIVGKNRQFYLGIGAQFLGEMVYDFGGNVASYTSFTPSALTPSTPGNGAGIGFGWQTSSIYFNFVAMPHTGNQVGLFLKVNFLGVHNNLKCHHIYAKYRGLTVGYTHSLFTDGAAEPMTIDFEGPNGYVSVTMFTAYWTQNFTKNISGAIGIDAPATSFTVNAKTEAVKARTPSIPLYLQYAWAGGNSHVRLSGIIRPMQYRNLAVAANRTLTGAGIQLSGMTTVAGPVSVQFNAVYGRGIGSYIQDDEGLGLDAVAVGKDGNMKTVRTMGLTGGLTFALSPKLSSNIVFSHAHNWLPDRADVPGNQYRYGDYFVANLIYSINKFVSAGIEYDYGYRKAVDRSSLHANRIQAQMAVTF